MEAIASTTFKHILVPTDFGESSRRAGTIAADLAAKYGATLTLVHSYEVPMYEYPGVIIPQDLTEAILDAAKAQLDQQLAALLASGAKASGVLGFGIPVQEIVGAIERTHADLVIMGTHGRKGINRLLMGSVAERIVRMSPVPVLTVH
jgi:nucleotide-binding universal stress UspA family protein